MPSAPALLQFLYTRLLVGRLTLPRTGWIFGASSPPAGHCLEETGEVLGVSRSNTRLLQADRGEPFELCTLTHRPPPRLQFLGRYIPLPSAIERADRHLLAAP